MSRPQVPLYRDHGLPQDRPTEANIGLWFSKMVNTWECDLRKLPDQVPARDGTKVLDKRQWLASVAAGAPVGDPEVLRDATSRLKEMVARLGGITLELDTATRLVAGKGLPHPVETAIVWHHTLGVPYLPGTSVKGVVRAWAEEWQGLADTDLVAQVFGLEGKEERAVGHVIFFDAIPIGPVRLEVDYMTPHYGPYYQHRDGSYPPADWYSPVPIPFLTVAPRQRFLFALAPRTRTDGELVRLAARWLEEALTILGAGAKTGVGYGLFAPATATGGTAGSA